MSEETTTSDGVVDSGADEAQLDDNIEQTEAESQDEDTSQTSEDDESEPDEESDNPEDADFKDWAAKKNLPLDDPLKIAKMYREAEQALGKSRQKEGQLKKAVTTANSDANVDDVQALRNELTALSFKIDHPESGPLESTMVDILEEKPWLANDLEAVLDIAKGRSLSDSASLLAARQAGKSEGRATAAQAGRAAQPRVSATNTAKANQKITLANVDQLIGANGYDWYVKNRDKINAALATG